MVKRKTNEGFGEDAARAETDHEVQMARAELFKIAKYAIELNRMLANVTEEEGLEAWQQAKITKAGDYIDSVYHALEYSEKVMTPAPDVQAGPAPAPAIPGMSESEINDYKALLEKAKSKAQQRYMGMVHSAQKGEKPASKEVAKTAANMKKSDAKDYASTKHKGLPKHTAKK